VGEEEAAARLLRDRSRVTRLLVLAELERDPGATLSDVARRLGVSVQAVSVYAKELASEGLLGSGDGGYAVTPRGLQELHEGVRRLRGAVDALATPLRVIRSTSAVAAARIRAGERVGLYMQEGDLAARPRHRSPSTGRAVRDAEPGDEVVVTDLAGLVELSPGRLRVVALPSPMEGGIARVDVPRLRAALREESGPRPDKVGALGTGAAILARRLGPLDFAFAADRASFNAAERGLHVRLFVTRDRLPESMAAFEELNAGTLKRVTVDLVEAPEAPP
jgi:predicted transcriptional regulator